ncbi:NUDIX hydrolase domain-like protein [Hypoxylon trugodes]|uniref:NUDIX hydrolase domain-like protein n=1 Tax=Hypoxylon trugodes TaxID=326681 RepID=UPI0021939CD8|nr:NUDIX hydrolase domain-like protein [Hypoxylon trugodes]KAI1384184.1 NUDIX hydrolase domain-like protein [Hypoxylon trugodes]
MATTSPPYHPRVGVAALIRDAQGRFVMGKRKGNHGGGTWQFPGGHLEMGETLIACAERETLEETGLKVKGLRVAAVTNAIFDPQTKHYVTVFVMCERENEEDQPVILEPEKCESWHWIPWDDVKRWCEHHGDEVTPEWANNKCFMPILELARNYPQLDSFML